MEVNVNGDVATMMTWMMAAAAAHAKVANEFVSEYDVDVKANGFVNENASAYAYGPSSCV